MKNKNILITICSVLLLTSMNTTYATSHSNITQKSIHSPIAYSVHAVDSGAVSLSAISVHKGKTAYVISGNARIKTMQRRILRLPGYIQIELKSKEGKVLETLKVRMHRKYGVSKAAHFDAVLKSTPPVGSTIVITHKR